MHVIKPHPAVITLFGRDGSVRKFASMVDALTHLGYKWIEDHVGPNFHVTVGHQRVLDSSLSGANQLPRYVRAYKDYDYILRDGAGATVVASDFYEVWKAIPRRRRVAARYDHFWFWDGAGPVPGTGGRYRSRYFRHPGTHAVRRDAVHCADEGEPRIRAKRSTSAIPTAWDDYGRSDIGNRSWKRHRKTQWKA